MVSEGVCFFSRNPGKGTNNVETIMAANQRQSNINFSTNVSKTQSYIQQGDQFGPALFLLEVIDTT